MKFFETNGETEKRKNITEKAQYVRRGGSLEFFKPADVVELQTYALDIKDIKLYDFLEKFWTTYGGNKPAGEVRP